MFRLICLSLLSSSSAIFIYAFIPNAQLQQLKVVKLVLWNCGDIELNPGPPQKRKCKSEVLRDFRRKAQKPFLLAINRAKGESPVEPNYKQHPSWWNTHIAFVNIYNEKTNIKIIACFQEIIDVLRSDKLDISSDLKQIATCYENLLNKPRSKQGLDKLVNWIDEQADRKTLTKVKDSKQQDQLVLSYLQRCEEKLNSGDKDAVSSELLHWCEQVLEASRRLKQVHHILDLHFICSKYTVVIKVF